ncbi:hypothetical protein [Mariniluteicoccus flavus]
MTRPRRRSRALGCLGVAVVLVGGAGVAGAAYLRSIDQLPPLPVEDRCVVTGSTGTVVLTREQASLTAIIVGASVQRGLNPRAATIAMATAYQESGIRNLDHGDRDSLGLFQQRPSKNWGTPAQLQDPFYASNAFYDALVKVPGWQTGDINDTAQAVQRSGHPDAYRKHEAKARVLAEAFTGQRGAGVACVDRRTPAGDPAAYAAALENSLGRLPVNTSGKTVRVSAGSPERAWAVAHHAVAVAGQHGITGVIAGGRTWSAAPGAAPWSVPAWSAAGASGDATTVVVTFR